MRYLLRPALAAFVALSLSPPGHAEPDAPGALARGKAPGAPARGKAPGALARGKAIAQANCAKCHAIGVTGASPNPKSPPLRTLSRKYPLSDLEEALAEGIVVGHEGAEMPQFRLSTDQIAALLAYLDKIQRR